MTAPVTLGELAALCISEHAGALNTHKPSPWDRLVAELRDAGYLGPDEDLARILGGATVDELIQAGYLPIPKPPDLARRAPADRSKLDLPLPADMVERIWAMTEKFRYVADGGYLRATHSTSAPYTAAQAIDLFGMKLVVQATARDGQFRTPIPGRAATRRLDRVLRRVGPALLVALSPVLAPVWVGAAVVLRARQRRRTGASSGRRTGSELNQWLLSAVFLAIPAIAIAAWFAIWASHLPPHGPAGRWIALGLAALFGAQNMIVLYFFVLGFSMDGSNEARLPAPHPIRYLIPRAASVLMVMLIVNVPLALILLVIGLAT